MAQTQGSAINWFEIPTRDIERAQRFYEAILETRLARNDMGGYRMAMFPAEPPGVGGCLVQGETAIPGAQGGTIVYLNAEPSLDAVLARVERAGGRIVVPRTEIEGGHGFFAIIADPEHNHVGLHAMN
ncbi:VOC family protein [Caldimonas thermodepolymerans]|uniref:VOC family protein n=1 Tax=Caldimonas thermodepolymerans TaxID=215580 RepID=UPI002235F63B|nr:VOC family protein [Caldimonas thermodepolymerans]UZG44085.1 VOC family protein [Caldimonas thermodepolymerans]